MRVVWGDQSSREPGAPQGDGLKPPTENEGRSQCQL